jgi:hypothetical protein
MPIRLHCDAPNCQRSTSVPLSTGLFRADLRAATGWWLVAGSAGTVVACCESHLNAALADGRGDVSGRAAHGVERLTGVRLPQTA